MEAEAFAESAGWGEDDVSRVVLGTTEAVGNAVQHGPGGNVHVRFGLDAGTLTVSVEDEGQGPSLVRLDSAGLPDDLALGGRGLYILSVLCDDVDVRDGAVHLVFRPGP